MIIVSLCLEPMILCVIWRISRKDIMWILTHLYIDFATIFLPDDLYSDFSMKSTHFRISLNT